MDNSAAIITKNLSHFYGDRCALDRLSLEIKQGEIFVFLGPNGGGKTTLFRLLSTLMPLTQGEASILGHDLKKQKQSIRQQIGVVFQSPSLDLKLTVRENLQQQAALYGLMGETATNKQQQMLRQLGIHDRSRDLCENLSGGLKRRVELAKGLLHQPKLLLLDEPSTGLDPGARSSMWDYLLRIRQEDQVTIILTTHLLEEAEKADRIAILHEGKLVAVDSPEQLKSTVGGDTLTIETSDAKQLASSIQEKFELTVQLVEQSVRLETNKGSELIPKLLDCFPQQIQRITLGKPTLEDVFIAKTGHQFWQQGDDQ